MACYPTGRHIYLANRGFIITPFHNMMLVPPVASDDAIGCLVEAWDACMGRSLALEVTRDGITVNSVAPGWIETGSSTEEEKTAGRHTPMRRSGTPQEVADLIAFLASDEATYITGQTIVIDGGNTIQDYKGPGEGYYS
ncbi:SDR family NAD(P)-dependent oxidoreductase [Desulfosarcina sp.]|uniref:SDR family NAD(P)-dependent oxidoreductase n=1 Tax=Desulfosarcina sp. TaxID=2027861 RepID=UPI0029B5EDA0|nr:SDR family oxidoreductase [Desulfosarcina sp.]MDX2452672.1 SDR family oxidoreductase [Desulfosarcina sp.]MDX2490447.1 SDR family oxidoreductase [Desulfosarcina sp.]